MAVPRFIANIGGRLKMVLTIATSAGAGDADKVPSTNASGVLDPSLLNAATTGANKIPILDGAGQLDPSTMPTGIGADTKTVVASETLAANDLVNLWNDAGTIKARKADATAEGKESMGFVKAGVASAANATVYFDGRITGMTGLTPGARYFLDSVVPGGVVLVGSIPSAAGNVQMCVGFAASATELVYEPEDPVTVA